MQGRRGIEDRPRPTLNQARGLHWTGGPVQPTQAKIENNAPAANAGAGHVQEEKTAPPRTVASSRRRGKAVRKNDSGIQQEVRDSYRKLESNSEHGGGVLRRGEGVELAFFCPCVAIFRVTRILLALLQGTCFSLLECAFLVIRHSRSATGSSVMNQFYLKDFCISENCLGRPFVVQFACIRLL